jgi:tetratricopeptide (TPR) repeat protein
MCGGRLDVTDGSTVAVCEYCGTQQTLSKSTDEMITNLFSRANDLRLQSEFDKAQDVYEKILDNDNSDAEAHWGVLLCKYGIEYVEDPLGSKRLPTCHRMRYESILTDPDYLAALDNGDASQQSVYASEALTISRLQKDILKIVKQEKPFDVFISYKETDEYGKRTPDSVIANDIYHELTQDGYKVFYSAITLEDKLGQAYEPYIFAALNSAKVMLVVGTKPAYFNAVWVKNEWSRFLSLMKEDKNRTLIPCYRDMDAYSLPAEFSHLQAQDMSKIGFINDIVRGMKKLLSKKESLPSEPVVINGGASAVSLLERAFLSMEDGEWEKADGLLEQVLNMEPKNALAYVGKLMAELHTKYRSGLADSAVTLESYNNYHKAVRFGDGLLISELEDYNKSLQLSNICYINLKKYGNIFRLIFLRSLCRHIWDVTP